MKEIDILVIGGGPAAVITSVTAGQMNPDMKIMRVRKLPNIPVPCSIPYIFNKLDGPKANIMPDKKFAVPNVDLVIDEAIDGNIEEKTILFKSGETVKYKKLVIATGSEAINPKFIKGYDKSHVHLVKKDNKYVESLYTKGLDAKNVVIIGAGFIGMEFADELNKMEGKSITVVEMLDHVLGTAFDREITNVVYNKFIAAGVKIMTSNKVVEITDDKVILDSGVQLDCDMVVAAIGAAPNTSLAEKLGLRMEKKGVWVDEYLRTSNKDVFAVGDCAAKIDFFTRRPTYTMLASTACAEARVAGANLFDLQVVRENKGTIGVFSTKIQGLILATAGLTEDMANEHGFPVITSTASSKDRHPAKLKDASNLTIKLIFSKNFGVILGGQVISGGMGAGEIINVIALAIQKQMDCAEIFTLQFGMHPLLTSAPTTYPLIVAAQQALLELRK